MSKSTTSTSLSDFAHAVDKLDASGSNWVMFQSRFTIAARQKRVWGQFDGSNKMPPKETSPGVNASDYDKKLEEWNDKEDLAKYLLSQKLPDSIFSKYMRKETVAEIWSAIVAEFTQKSMLVKSSLHSEFMALRYTKGANLREEFDRVRMKYEQLMNAGVPVSADDYRTLVINFLPGDLSTFIAQLSANTKMLTLQILKKLPGSTDSTLSAPDQPIKTLLLEVDMMFTSFFS